MQATDLVSDNYNGNLQRERKPYSPAYSFRSPSVFPEGLDSRLSALPPHRQDCADCPQRNATGRRQARCGIGRGSRGRTQAHPRKRRQPSTPRSIRGGRKPPGMRNQDFVIAMWPFGGPFHSPLRDPFVRRTALPVRLLAPSPTARHRPMLPATWLVLSERHKLLGKQSPYGCVEMRSGCAS